MVGFLITADQLRGAPAEVRDWLRATVDAVFAGDGPARPAAAAEEVRHPHLQGISVEEAAAILARIDQDYVTTQVFFELGRESSPVLVQPPHLHRSALAEILRHTRLAAPQQLEHAFAAIERAFRDLRRDPDAMLIAFDGRGNCYVHEETFRSIGAVWHSFLSATMARASERAPNGQAPIAGIPDQADGARAPV